MGFLFQLRDHSPAGFPQWSSGLSDEGIHTNQGQTMPSKGKGCPSWFGLWIERQPAD